jgi:galactose mutarotase-like enzyme
MRAPSVIQLKSRGTYTSAPHSQETMTNIAIHSAAMHVEIARLGAELQSVRDAEGRDYLHDGASFWAARAPLLFPIVGALKDNRHIANGAAHTMQRHGFARHSQFDMVGSGPDRAHFRLSDSEETRAAYPYRFQLDAAYALQGARLTALITVTNTDSGPIPVAFGFHPAFKWPLPEAGTKFDHAIDFALSETAPVFRLNAEGLLARETPGPLKGRRLVLTDELFQEDALIFLTLNSRSLRFGPADGGLPALNLVFEGMPQLGIWTKPGAPFLCIEPWHGYASPAHFSGPLVEKPGSVNLAPGEAKSFGMSVELVQPV